MLIISYETYHSIWVDSELFLVFEETVNFFLIVSYFFAVYLFGIRQIEKLAHHEHIVGAF